LVSRVPFTGPAFARHSPFGHIGYGVAQRRWHPGVVCVRAARPERLA